ncbi:HlyD-family type I secretion protein [Azoarcus sp. KH32C]|nr:HlyD-family type I secretion protein [Azoarcus sp. KH32C]
MVVHQTEARRLARSGKYVLLGGLLPVVLWLALAPLSSAVVAPGVVKVDLNRRTVQHAEGGIVSEVKVRDGQHVKQGDTLIVLGDVGVAADENRWTYRVKAERLSMVRLEAEQAFAGTLVFPAELVKAAAEDARLAELLGKERALFLAHRSAIVGQLSLLGSQRAMVFSEISALKGQIAQAELALRHQQEDLDRNRSLQKDGFISTSRITQLEASVADYGVKLEEKRTDLARAEQRVVEIDLKVRSLESDFRQQASDQLKVTAARLTEIEQEQRKSVDAAARQVIVSPADGEVIGLKFTTPGAVIAPREPIADIVPKDPRLVVEARLRTEDSSRVTKDQLAELRFTAFKYRTTKMVQGRVTYVSADRLVDQNANVAYFSALIEVDPASLADAGNIQLLAGMPAEVYIKGEERTPLQYLVEPITQVLRRAGRER